MKKMITVRKIILYPIGDKKEVERAYDWLKEGMIAQNKAMNEYMTGLYCAMVMDASKDDRKELDCLYSRISTSKKGSAYSVDNIIFPKGFPCGAMKNKVTTDFKIAMKKGLGYGVISLPTYKKTNPLYIPKEYANKLYHNYESIEDFNKHLYNKDFEMFLKFADSITFKIVFGNPHKSMELRSIFSKIVEGVYDIGGSSIGINKNKIILNLTIKMPDKKNVIIGDTVCGVDVGMAIPAVCGLNNDEYAREYIGSFDDLTRMRTKMQAQYKRMQKSVKYAKGGHGRTRKVKPLDNFKERERNYVQTYNHTVSKRVVDFALRNGARYINLEDLSQFANKKRNNQFVLRNWSYGELQQMIAYKADRAGIIVRRVNPAYTSQTCACCGHYEEGQRINQSKFICKNPDCKMFGVEVNADFNAGKTISKSTDIISIYKNGEWEQVNKSKDKTSA